MDGKAWLMDGSMHNRLMGSWGLGVFLLMDFQPFDQHGLGGMGEAAVSFTINHGLQSFPQVWLDCDV